MAKRRHNPELERFLKAERAGQDRAAEAALTALFRTLPMAAPVPGLADKVLLASGIDRSRAWSWKARSAVAAAVASAGLALAWLLPILSVLSPRLAPGKVVGGAVHGLVSAAQGLAEWFSFWFRIADFIDTLLVAVTAPPVVLALILTGSLAVLLTRGLVNLVVDDRSPHYV